MMRFSTGLVALGMLIITGAAYAQAPDLQNMDIVLRAVPAGPVARVNGESIDAEEFKELYRSELAHIISSNPQVEFSTGDRVQLGLLCLRQLIDRRVLLQEARKRNLTVPESDIDKAYQQQIEQIKNALSQAGAADPTEAELLEAAGTTKDVVRAGLRDALLVEKMRDELLKENKVTVADGDVKKFYEENKAQFMRPDMCHMKQIFFPAPPESSKLKDAAKQRIVAREKANEALKRIQAGQSFEAVARDMSEGQFADQGGDWGNLPASRLPSFLLDKAYTMKPEEVSGIIESQHGFHIIKLVSITAGAEPDFDKIKPIIERRMLNEKGEDVVTEFCKKVMDNGGKLEVFLELEKSIVLESGSLGQAARAN